MLRILVFLVACFVMSDADAQMLFDSAPKKTNPTTKSLSAPKPKRQVENTEEEGGIKLGDLTKNTSSNNNDLSKALSDSLARSDKKKDDKAEEVVADEDIFIPEGELYRLNTPTADNSERGGQAFVEVDEKGRMKKAENIFLFYDNFKITNYMSNTATCDVRFNILSNLDRKVTQLDVKLVWPDITTTLSFSNISPNTQTYYNYSLIGNGCYGMDIAPNIVVNRCRVKGMTASECASKLIWLSK